MPQPPFRFVKPLMELRRLLGRHINHPRRDCRLPRRQPRQLFGQRQELKVAFIPLAQPRAGLREGSVIRRRDDAEAAVRKERA